MLVDKWSRNEESLVQRNGWELELGFSKRNDESVEKRCKFDAAVEMQPNPRESTNPYPLKCTNIRTLSGFKSLSGTPGIILLSSRLRLQELKKRRLSRFLVVVAVNRRRPKTTNTRQEGACSLAIHYQTT